MKLMVTADLIALAMRRQELLAGKNEPAQADFRGVCRKCAFGRTCNPSWPRFGQIKRPKFADMDKFAHFLVLVAEQWIGQKFHNRKSAD